MKSFNNVMNSMNEINSNLDAMEEKLRQSNGNLTCNCKITLDGNLDGEEVHQSSDATTCLHIHNGDMLYQVTVDGETTTVKIPYHAIVKIFNIYRRVISLISTLMSIIRSFGFEIKSEIKSIGDAIVISQDRKAKKSGKSRKSKVSRSPRKKYYDFKTGKVIYRKVKKSTEIKDWGTL